MNLKGKKFLVTGGSGFIGSHLIERLTEYGAYVENFDLSQGRDIQDEKQLSQAIKKKSDAIFHLAGFSGSKESNENIEKSFKINTLATVNLIEHVLKYSPKTKIVLSSSRLEYGTPKYLPVDEKHPTNPISAYGLSKLCATQMVLIYYKTKSLNVTVFRTSNVYGSHPHAKFSGYNIVNHFIDLAKQNKTLTIFGEGDQKRDYLYIDDMIDAFILSADSKANGKIYNLGLGSAISLKEMAELIIKTIGKGRIRYVRWPDNYKAVETGDYVTDISKIKRELGFSPKIDFETGILRTINNN
ncbi:hypothetical protein A3G14_05445 [Candidatus Curtissbacteria bacterium RIFCSPLOWO2_12_FULL_38_9]|uniref:NAD-dependent epimerase/dehydratase domain-containing protein n=1 Tax=Candidatus Curtissbacteria bacterium RIFCSPLOWO2_12_FULL_38_9 TaxID=1797735 RepID=A0A1F5IA77_9BACT|nr:MAG: hypothetical protein A2775_00170 [Candidatus Curtissbacteria bacterium RIFCSPHIGHO2_01_FULL_39_57]OGD90066.1 MAG: hypothetical protein A3E11_01375 [Candidatus Curtissbacteria bacterium RIFCSPHIGHO2_12_FULL_38_37]OGE13297.1 MAG: hypothetical protein A3G14_05445 [Candidatus Curtissbacteria bacterium RIFCSPLOWO2_12_FULL_38_9]